MPARVNPGHECVVPSEKSDGESSAELVELARTPHGRTLDTSASSRKGSDGESSAALAESLPARVDPGYECVVR